MGGKKGADVMADDGDRTVRVAEDRSMKCRWKIKDGMIWIR